MSETDSLHELAESFGLDTELFDPEEIPAEIVSVMEYTAERTGLLGDYHDGHVTLAEGGEIIQWYPRATFFSAHDDLLHWVQYAADGVFIGQVGTRPHVITGEPSAYIEIHPKSKWGRDDE